MARSVAFKESEVLNQVLEIFWHKGFHDTSTQDIMEATGLSKSSLYNSFEDKYTLFKKVLAQYQQSAHKSYSKLLLESDHRTAYEKIQELLEMAADGNVSDESQKGCFLLNTAIELAPHNNELQELLDENRRFMVDLFATVIQQGIDNGDVDAGLDSHAVGQFYFSLMNGIKVDGKITRDSEVFKKSVETGLKILK